jgi:hypothetical protein
MRHLKYLAIFASLFFFIQVACNSNNIKARQQLNEQNPKTLIDTCDAFHTIKAFLKWYSVNIYDINKINLIKIVNDNNKSIYRIDFNNTTKYILKLKATEYFSNIFLQEKQKYFENCDKKFINIKQEDGPAEGLDADLLLYCQDWEFLLNNLNKINYKLIKKTNTFSIIVIDYKNSYDLIFKINSNCQIDYIVPKQMWNETM